MTESFGTHIAIDESGKRVHISEVPPLDIRRANNLKYTCELCHGELIARTGKVVAHHFAHKSVETCDSWAQPMTAWHKDWQDCFEKDFQERVMEENGRIHRADVSLPRGANTPETIIEFQHSPISQSDFWERSIFYMKYRREIFWIVDWREKIRNASIQKDGVHWALGTDIEDLFPGDSCRIDFSRRLPPWTGSFKRFEYIREHLPRVHVLVQLSGEGGKGLLLDVESFHYYSVRGTVADAEKWIEMMKGDWKHACRVFFDMSEIDRGLKSSSGYLGEEIKFPDTSDVAGRFHWEKDSVWREDSVARFTAVPRTFTLKLDPEFDTIEIPGEERVDFVEEPIFASEETIEKPEQDEDKSPEKDYSPSHIMETCKGYCVYLPEPTPADAVFHAPSPDVVEGKLIPGALFVARVHQRTSSGYPHAAVCDLVYRGDRRRSILIAIGKGSKEEVAALEAAHEEHPDLSMLYADLSLCERSESGYDLIELANFVLGRTDQGFPDPDNVARQWLYNPKGVARQ